MKSILPALFYYSFIKPMSFLPFFILYRFSDVMAFVLNYILRYRDKVILTNLQNSFPEKSPSEINEIQHKFYIHLCDVIIESLKGFNLSEKEAKKKLRFENLEDVNRFFKEGKDIIILSGHYGNWESCAAAIPLFLDFEVLGIYKELKNTFFDEKIKKTRSKFGLKLCEMTETKKMILEKSEKPKGTVFLTDQTPSNPGRSHWMNFLNQDTPVFLGAERYAKILNTPLIYMSIIKEKRGVYVVKCQTLFEFPKETKKGEITEKHTKILEEDIKRAPEYWLWSHKRWKHKREIA